MIALDELQGLVAAELNDVVSADAAGRLQALLVQPVLMRCTWDYGEPGQTFPCWKVAREKGRSVAVVHCDQGFGPQIPWGLVWDDQPEPSMGQDSGWFATLREAAADILDLPPATLSVP